MHRVFALLLAATLAAGCHDHDTTAPRDIVPPAAPRGLRSVTGDQEVFLSWLANTEGDVVGYRIYVAPCAAGDNCPYDRVGETAGTTFSVRQLANGQTRYFAVSAYDAAGNESALSYDTVFDTPRPEGYDLVLANYLVDSLRAGYDFSEYASGHAVCNYSSSNTDVYFGASGGMFVMFAPYTDTDIQDAGYARTLDAVDFAPDAGWSPTGTAELIVGHCYVVWTRDDNYAKFRVTSLSTGRVVMDWAYQTDPGNRELRARRGIPGDDRRVRRPIVWSS
jgi:hypothetical protein